jgi:hypothetical protein
MDDAPARSDDGWPLPWPEHPVVLWLVISVVLVVLFAGGALLPVWLEGGQPRAPLGLFLLVCTGSAAFCAAVPFAVLRFLLRRRTGD